MRRFTVTKPVYAIVPVCEPLGEGMGWRECRDAAATWFFVELRGHKTGGFPTRADAQDYIDQHTR